MTTLEVLKAAREHLSDPARWYKGDLRDPGWAGPADQVPCCAMGAIDLVGYVQGPASALISALPDEYKVIKGLSLIDYNDDPRTTHADILALFDRAIAAEEARQ